MGPSFFTRIFIISRLGPSKTEGKSICSQALVVDSCSCETNVFSLARARCSRLRVRPCVHSCSRDSCSGVLEPLFPTASLHKSVRERFPPHAEAAELRCRRSCRALLTPASNGRVRVQDCLLEYRLAKVEVGRETRKDTLAESRRAVCWTMVDARFGSIAFVRDG